MTAIATLADGLPPITATGSRLRLRLARRGLDIAAWPADDLSALKVAGDGANPGRPALLLGVSPRLARIGPVIGTSDRGCAHCLAFWLEKNRPAAGAWKAIPPGADAPNVSWLPAVHEALAVLADEFLDQSDGAYFIDLDTVSLKSEVHRYLPSPNCPRCAPRRSAAPIRRAGFAEVRKPRRDAFRTADMARAAGRLRTHYVDYRTGIVRHMYRDSTSTMLPMWGAETALPDVDGVELGFGRAPKDGVAESVAILEALERFCSRVHDNHAVVRGSYRDLLAQGQPAVDPETFILCAPEQAAEPDYGLVPYSPGVVVDWVWGYSCARGQGVLVPKQLAFYGEAAVPAEDRYVIETSNGCALGSTYEEAVFHGLLELIERDAYMTRWHVQGRPRRIDLAAADCRDLLWRAQAEGLDLFAFSIGLEIDVPVVLAMAVDPASDAPVASYCASGAHPVPEAAIRSALVEVCSSIGVYQPHFGRERKRARALYADASAVTTMRDHVLLYSLPESLDRLAFLDRRRSPQRPSHLFGSAALDWHPESLTADLRRLVSETLKVASDVIVIDQTDGVLDPMQLHCVKVLAPGLHPVTFGHQYRRISRSRLDAARRHLQAQGEECATDINPHPHNFP